MSKAYDRVEWGFLEVVMRRVGFHERWIAMILRCISTVSYSFLINGEVRGLVLPSRGLRQGDSLSPYLFLLCAEALSRLIMEAEVGGRLHGVRVCPEAPMISHLLFADDSLIFFRANEEECGVVRDILLQYERVSGQQVNFQKSSISFSRNICLDAQFQLAAQLGVTRVTKHDKYLGLPIEVSYSKVEAFQYVQEKIEKRSKGWRGKTLSVAGREILIKAVLQSIPNYVMSCFELLKHLCIAMHSLLAKFWWGDNEGDKKIHWLAWDRLCKPKSEGGMGFRNLIYFNRALLAKQGWRILSRPEALVTRLLRAKYFPQSNFMQASLGSDPSFVW
ncbi:hypothetical protein ACLB2K_022964 [Fragaria x ananassa]